MTEAEWLACDDPTPMLVWLECRASERKFRLFAAACCRRLYQVFKHELLSWAIQSIEQVADGALAPLDTYIQIANEISEHQVEITCQQWNSAVDLALFDLDFYARMNDLSRTDLPEAFQPYVWAIHTANEVVYRVCKARWDLTPWFQRVIPGRRSHSATQLASERAALTHSLHNIFGNPFRPVVADPSWLTATVRDLAAAVYAERAFDRLPILADALEDAGCDNADVLTHCRGDGPHVRGCWVVDLILGKN